MIVILAEKEYAPPRPRFDIQESMRLSDVVIVQREDGTTDIVKCRYAYNIKDVDNETLDWYLKEHLKIRA